MIADDDTVNVVLAAGTMFHDGCTFPDGCGLELFSLLQLHRTLPKKRTSRALANGEETSSGACRRKVYQKFRCE
jgi:hypothetical protein